MSLPLPSLSRQLVKGFWPNKPMGLSAPATNRPHFFLVRRFAGDNDLMVIFNSKRCRYQCDFCQLPAKSSRKWIAGDELMAQFSYVLEETKHTLNILDRVSLGNEGSILDSKTFDPDALDTIVKAIRHLPHVRTLVLETRLEFVETERLMRLAALAPHTRLSMLTGFESHDEVIRDKVLRKREPLALFEQGLDRVAEANAMLTAYVLYKPDPAMTDKEAYDEADRSIRYLEAQCGRRGIPLAIRLNPMYIAEGSKWEQRATAMGGYIPPRLSDVLRLSEGAIARGTPVYIGLSSEGLSGKEGSYKARDDYSPRLTERALQINEHAIAAARIQIGAMTPVGSGSARANGSNGSTGSNGHGAHGVNGAHGSNGASHAPAVGATAASGARDSGE